MSGNETREQVIETSCDLLQNLGEIVLFQLRESRDTRAMAPAGEHDFMAQNGTTATNESFAQTIRSDCSSRARLSHRRHATWAER